MTRPPPCRRLRHRPRLRRDHPGGRRAARRQHVLGGEFKSAKGVVNFAVALETAFVGAYVLAAGVLSTPELRSTAAAIGADEGSHLGFFTGASGRVAVAPTVPMAAKSLDAVIKTVGTYQKKT